MLVYRVFTHVCSVLSASAVHFLSTILHFHSLLDRHEDGLGLCDFLYFRSRFLQTHCNYRLNYRAFENGLMWELSSLVSKCGIRHEFHPDVDQGGGRTDLYRLISYDDASNQKSKRTVVLVPGMLQSIDIFICGGKNSSAQLLCQGCEVWLLNKNTRGNAFKESVSTTVAHREADSLQLVQAEVCEPLTVQGMVDSLTCENLNAVAKYIEDYNIKRQAECDVQEGNTNMTGYAPKSGTGSFENTGVCWIGHSTACSSILAALTYSSSVHASVTAELRKRTTGAVLLSPVITLTHLNRYARSATPSYPARTVSSAPQPPSLLLEVILHSPDSAYRLFGSEMLVQSLQQWRDVFIVPTYCKYVIAPLCRSTFGWTFQNIAPHRRNDLLQYLLQPTSTHALVSLLYASQGNIHAENAYFGSRRVYNLVQNVYTTYRWLWRCTLFIAEVSLSLASKLVSFNKTTVACDRTSKEHVCAAVKDTTSSSTLRADKEIQDYNNNTSVPTPRSAVKSSINKKPRILSFVGSEDPLSNLAELESTLAALREQYSFENDVRVIAGYEHMDTLWADTAPEIIFSAI